MIPALNDALRLYVIPDLKVGKNRSLMEQAEAALDGGATTIQLRDKTASGRELFELAGAIKRLCELYDAMFIVNDRLDIALAVGAHGVHIGPSDIPLEEVRRLFPASQVVGVSVATPEAAQQAGEAGADYLGVGSIYPTPSKSNATVVGIDRLAEVRKATKLPIVAIGGITAEHVPEVMGAEAQGVAMISEVVGAEDITLAAKNVREAVDSALAIRG